MDDGQCSGKHLSTPASVVKSVNSPTKPWKPSFTVHKRSTLWISELSLNVQNEHDAFSGSYRISIHLFLWFHFVWLPRWLTDETTERRTGWWHLPNHACCSPATSMARPKSASFTAAPFSLLARRRFSGCVATDERQTGFKWCSSRVGRPCLHAIWSYVIVCEIYAICLYHNTWMFTVTFNSKETYMNYTNHYQLTVLLRVHNVGHISLKAPRLCTFMFKTTSRNSGTTNQHTWSPNNMYDVLFSCLPI